MDKLRPKTKKLREKMDILLRSSKSPPHEPAPSNQTYFEISNVQSSSATTIFKHREGRSYKNRVSNKTSLFYCKDCDRLFTSLAVLILHKNENSTVMKTKRILVRALNFDNWTEIKVVWLH